MNSLHDLNFDPNSQAWVFSANRQLKADEENWLSERLEMFTRQWNSHGNELKTFVSILEHQLLVVVVDQSHGQASGCSIDKLMAFMRTIEAELPLDWTDRSKVVLKVSEEIVISSLKTIKERLSDLDPNDTLVYNTSASCFKELLNNFEMPLSKSWLSRFVDLKTTA
jgi:tetrahydromethanopterin S-methyltransferase subunit B